MDFVEVTATVAACTPNTLSIAAASAPTPGRVDVACALRCWMSDGVRPASSRRLP
jgi:hypothetical protein